MIGEDGKWVVRSEGIICAALLCLYSGSGIGQLCILILKELRDWKLEEHVLRGDYIIQGCRALAQND
jgi:hypothetical protein